MSYHSWTTDGFGFCVDDIKTNPERLLKLAAMKPDVLEQVRDYLNEYFEGEEYSDDKLVMADFDDLEGDYCERDIAYVLYHVIDELPIVYTDDYDGVPYILYCPKYPWCLYEEEKELTQENVKEIFNKYISVLTDQHIVIDYYSVENGG